jgi:hypothetical protein
MFLEKLTGASSARPTMPQSVTASPQAAAKTRDGE